MAEVLHFLLLAAYLGLVARIVITPGPPSSASRWGMFVLSAALAGVAGGKRAWVDLAVCAAAAAFWATAILVMDEARRRGRQE